jgi:hypothetical protein
MPSAAAPSGRLELGCGADPTEYRRHAPLCNPVFSRGYLPSLGSFHAGPSVESFRARPRTIIHTPKIRDKSPVYGAGA